MRKIKILAIILALVMSIACLSACNNDNDEKAKLQEQLDTANAKVTKLEKDLAEAKVYKPDYFIQWVEKDSGHWRTIVNGSLKTDADSAPTQADIEKILHYASLAPTSNGKTDYFLVAVTDEAEQNAIIGSTYGQATSAGTVTILVVGDRLYDATVRADGGTVAVQPDRGYYDVGIVSGYIQTAALALGYGTHYFMSPALPKDNGQFDSGAIGYDISKYVEGYQYTNGNTGETVNVAGNCKFVCAIVIGTPDENAETTVTEHAYPNNWAIWQPPQAA